MSVVGNKDKIQRDALNAWFKAGCRGTIQLATAGGKTRIGILAISHFAKQAGYNFKALIVTPTVAIQDEWRKEFAKWGEDRVLIECVDIYCINTAREFEQEFYDIGVFDEIHNYVNGEINVKVFYNNKFDKILGLSASIAHELQPIIKKLAPICYKLGVYEALDLGLISNFTVYSIPVELNKKEREEYDKLSKTITFVKQKTGNNSWGKIGKRKTLVYNTASKIDMIKELSEKFGDKYGIFFSQTKDYADMVNKELGTICRPHHSGLSMKNRQTNLKRFADKRSKVKRISSAKTLDEGVTLPRLEFGVIAAGSSKEKQLIQRVGRTLRLDIQGKHAVIVYIYTANTVEEKWMKKAQLGFEVININSIKDIKWGQRH